MRTIVGTLSGRMTAARTDLAQRKPPGSLAAYEHFLRGDALPVGTPEVEAEARHHFLKAIELDPGYARAYALLSFNLEQEWLRDMSDSDRLRDEAFELARRAVALDGNDALCHLAMLWAYVDRRSYELAEQHLNRAVALNPNQPSTQSNRGTFFICLGEPEKAIEGLTEAMRLDPFFAPSWYWGELGCAHFLAKRYDEAIAAMRRASTLSVGEHGWLVASCALAGKPDLAREYATDLLRRLPDFSAARFLSKQGMMRAEDSQHLADGLRKGGLPE